MCECGQMLMRTVDERSPEAPLQVPQLALEHPSIRELEEDDPLFGCACDHRSERGLDPRQGDALARPGANRGGAEGSTKGLSKRAVRVAALPHDVIESATLPERVERSVQAPGSTVGA